MIYRSPCDCLRPEHPKAAASVCPAAPGAAPGAAPVPTRWHHVPGHGGRGPAATAERRSLLSPRWGPGCPLGGALVVPPVGPWLSLWNGPGCPLGGVLIVPSVGPWFSLWYGPGCPLGGVRDVPSVGSSLSPQCGPRVLGGPPTGHGCPQPGHPPEGPAAPAAPGTVRSPRDKWNISPPGARPRVGPAVLSPGMRVLPPAARGAVTPVSATPARERWGGEGRGDFQWRGQREEADAQFMPAVSPVKNGPALSLRPSLPGTR